ncbi:MAG: formylglycine-generating enzyme family protein [Rubrivivax sp.]|nr:formylglycine-generating enzyme family protein [Rubrivivax sp.]
MSTARLAAALRRHLTVMRPTAEPDLAQVLRRVVRQQPLTRLPRRQRARWPARVRVVVEDHPGLRPLGQDLALVLQQMRRTLGSRLIALDTDAGPGGCRGPSGKPHPLRASGEPLLILGTAGLDDEAGSVPDEWLKLCSEWTRAMGSRAPRPLLLTPMPKASVPRAIAEALPTLCFGDSGPLHPLRPVRQAAHAEPQPAWPRDQTLAPEAAPDQPAGAWHSGLRTLRAALFGNPWIPVALLRDLRLRLAAAGVAVDVSSELAIWRDPGVASNAQACALTVDGRQRAEADFAALPALMQQLAVTTHLHHLQTESPLTRTEYALAVRPWLKPGVEAAAAVADGAAEADRLARLACAALRGPSAGGGLGLDAYFGRLGQRAPTVVAAGGEALQAAWAIAHREALSSGRQQALPGMALERLSWVWGEQAATVPLGLSVVQQAVGPEGRRVEAWLKAVAQAPGQHAVAKATGVLVQDLRGPFVRVELVTDPAPETPATKQPHGGLARDVAGHVVLGAGDSTSLSGHLSLRVLAPGREIGIEAFVRPNWARAITFDQGRWQAQSPDGRWLTWVPRSRVRWLDGVTESSFLLPHGAWWDSAPGFELRQRDVVASRPEWAARHGIDDYGLWAEFDVHGRRGTVTQRMRWIPPGEFWMGSPESEPERVSDGEWAETRHRVILTQGFWLGETACTQALWDAVLGENPAEFKGDLENPVEQVSWRDIHDRFLPGLNAEVVGLEAVLPTEAQREYACRAGTQTPFWFGDQITPEQVNYDGNYPYSGGAKGMYREQTIPAKALDPNGWGLHQMHGNVWEWCADWLGDYGTAEQVDPKGPEVGRGRVLRGSGWHGYGRYCRSAYRFAYAPDGRNGSFGFRLARGLAPGAAAQLRAGGEPGPKAEPQGRPPGAERPAGVGPDNARSKPGAAPLKAPTKPNRK